MYIEYRERKACARKVRRIPIIERKYEKMAREVLTHGGSFKSGQWNKSNLKQYLDDYHVSGKKK
jgi:hypothetical protein